MSPTESKAPGTTSAPRGAVSSKYGAVTTERGTFHPGEPVFILRAADALAIRNVARYRNDLAAIEDPDKAPSPDELKALDDLVGTISEWAVANPEKVKIPHGALMGEHNHDAALSDLKARATQVVNAAERLVQAVTGTGDFNLRPGQRMTDLLAERIETALDRGADVETTAEMIQQVRDQVTDGFEDLIQSLREEAGTFGDVVDRAIVTIREEDEV